MPPFEAAVDTIVTGDAVRLANLLQEDPELARARSTREHRSTLLHYVSANGVEDERQKTPANILDIARLLLRAGADVNAESEAYGGRWTTLGLTATSGHPENAGVQLALMELLLEHGAALDAGLVKSCLRNGRGQAAEFLAERGAALDIEGAAGTGRLELVKRLYEVAAAQQRIDAFAWACQFGRKTVVAFFLDNGMDPGFQPLPHHGQTGLHWSALSGEVDTVRLLLDRGAPVEARDRHFGTTPLSWALYAWGNGARATMRVRLNRVAALLIAAGAKVEPDWLRDPRILADAGMSAALRRT